MSQSDFSIVFGANSEEIKGSGKYKLVELPKELLAIIESGTQQCISIRGRPDDDAVVCTADKTYGIRAVTISNAYYVLTPPNTGESGDAMIRGTASQLTEILPSIAKLHRLRGMLRGSEYDGEDVDNETHERRLLEDVKSEIQASDAQLEAGMKNRHILVLNGELRPITSEHLNSVLELILNTLAASSLSHNAAPVSDIIEVLQSDHEIPSEVTLQVLSWFGAINTPESGEKSWSMDASKVVRQLGIGILSSYRNQPISEKVLIEKWKIVVGDKFEDQIDIDLLSGNYISFIQASSGESLLSYFPSAELPINPADRFSELFIVKPRWKAQDILPFLDDTVADAKERDKLLMKFTRSIVDKEGIVWYTTKGGTVLS